MKKIYTIIVLLAFISLATHGQTVFMEDFSSGVPPSGWSIDAQSDNWIQEISNNAGGTAPEAMFSWTPQFTGETRLISPATDLTGNTMAGFSFRHMVDHYGGPYTIGVATRSGGGDWTSVWSVENPSASIPGEMVDFSISNSDVGQPDFEICFYFSGDSYNINYWYIDDARLYIPFEHDVASKKILGDTYFDAGNEYTASALIKNAGQNAETFDVVLEIYDGTNSTLLFTETQNVTMDAGDENTITYSAYVLPYENYLYEVVVYTDLDSDMDPDNDMASKYIYTYTTEREMVVLEIGTGTWCVFCPGAAMGADELIANDKNVAVLEHHSGDDYENAYSGDRVSYYGITGFPTAVFDGVLSHVGGNASTSIYGSYLPLYDQRKDIRTAFSCNIYGENTGGNEYYVVATIDKLGPAMNANVVLHIAVSESEIPETWFVMDHLNFVTRLMLPDANGTSVDILSNEYIEVEESFTLDPDWDVNHCEIVYFLQDTDTKEILQGGKVMVNDLIPVGIEDELSENGIAINNIYPNPFSNITNINFGLAEAGRVEVIISDMTGRQVALITDSEMQAGNHQIKWEVAADLPDGLYYCTVRTNKNTMTQKVILQR